MKRIARTNQGGSAITFAIIGAILVLVLAAGIYFAYQRGANIRSAAPIIGSTNQETTPKPEKSDDQSSDKTKTNSGDVNQSSTDQQTASTQPGEATGQIPQTGPMDGLYTLAVLAFLAFAAVRYVRSRTSLRSL
jgi:hypothetical protein